MRILVIVAAAALGLIAGPAAAGTDASTGAAAAKSNGEVLLLAGAKNKAGKAIGIGPGNSGVLLPPGQAKKWARGQYLPKTIIWTPAPAIIIAKLKPVPPGHRYVVIDGQVLLIALATGLILDALDVI